MTEKEVLVSHIFAVVIVETLSQSPVELEGHLELPSDIIQYNELILKFRSFCVLCLDNTRQIAD